MENKPTQPDAPEIKQDVDTATLGNPEHGIPPETMDAEPTGLPTSDRHHSETTPAKT